ncbi:hypothetical protein AMAG_03039 [Allomyces macrogynus ATCC 38327]|uniref:AB hydrolase-1 domain-containing protein n=1 Tax=Allomyces macrogynus (strain ATCC 38327) TaxID=578462 RepID=A0A0L0S4E2_ALLM3|nr:hypothetical protein AMAG_03039 [Allomyces macrogynus ATCC 38327]|eukprot:KNE57315.1 hypothetical protein AMAG_03039 [Allomyces macrogynus ATCC 38327]
MHQEPDPEPVPADLQPSPVSAPAADPKWSIPPFRTWSAPVQVGAVAVGLPALVYLYKCTMLVLFQNEILYMRRWPPGARSRPLPTPPKSLAVWDVHLPRLVSRKLPALHGLWIQSRTATRPKRVIVYLQGNGGNIAHRFDKFDRLLTAAGRDEAAILAVGYRGYGLSRGRPGEEGIVDDAARFLALARRPQEDVVGVRWSRATERGADYEEESDACAPPPAMLDTARTIIAYGHSLGGTVAVTLATRPAEHPPCDADLVVVENTFTSARDMVKALYPSQSPFHYLGVFLRSKWDSLAAVRAHQDCPPAIALVASTADEIVPPRMMKALYEAMVAQWGDDRVRWFAVEEGLHNVAFERPGWTAAWREIVRWAEMERASRAAQGGEGGDALCVPESKRK